MIGLLAFEKFESELEKELGFLGISIQHKHDRLFIIAEDFDCSQLVWAQLIAPGAQIIDIDSIGNAAKILKSASKRWCHYSFSLHRRSELIQEQVFKFKPKNLNFLQKIEKQDWGFFCLLEEKKLFSSPKINSSLPLGFAGFNEDKETPPSRAYLKLWELFTVHLPPPNKGAKVMDLGSCPGGWTWVLSQMECNVISVDKAPLDPKIAKLPNITYLKKDAFTLEPKEIGKIDWLFSDIICYPNDLYELAQKWISSGLVKNFACTIKYQGETDFETTKKFLEIPGSRVVHLNANKHEVTWICLNSTKEIQ